jgi:hypothetical protein
VLGTLLLGYPVLLGLGSRSDLWERLKFLKKTNDEKKKKKKKKKKNRPPRPRLTIRDALTCKTIYGGEKKKKNTSTPTDKGTAPPRP